MIDVKKLITGFLILATAAGASGIILSFVSGSSVTAQTPAGPQIDGVAMNTTSSVADNAFVDTGSLQGNAAEVLSDTVPTSTQAAASDPNNLTSDLADSFLNGLVASNPNGVATDQSGTPEFTPPDTTAVAQDLSADPAFQDFSAPDWAAEADVQLVKASTSSSPADISQYNSSLTNIFNKYFISTNLQSAVSDPGSDSAGLSYVSSEVQGALNDTLALQAPASLVNFQKSLVRVLVYEKDATALGQVANTDPVKASLILQNEQDQYSLAVTALQNQMQSASAVGLLFDKSAPTASLSLVAKLFGAQTANAQWITFDPAAFGQLVLSYVKDTIVQILKNTLVTLIQQKVLKWIQGSGAPRFVTDWGSELVNSFQTAAINKLNSAMQCVPSYQAPILKILLSTPAIAPGNANSCAAQFNGQLNNNLTNFSNLYNHFTNFNDYFAVMGPTGNTWSNLITIHDSALTAGSNAQAANTNQNIASQGFKGSQVCDDNSDPTNGSHQVCQDMAGRSAAPNGTSCPIGYALITIPNNGACADGSTPKTTSPGAATGQSLMSALQSGVQNITSADSIAGILNALLSSLLNTLAQNAINYSTQAINNAITAPSVQDSGLSGISPSAISVSSSTSPQAAVQCLPSVQPATISSSTGVAIANLAVTGGAIDTTCASNNTCPITENSDGSPIYNWIAPGSVQNVSGTPITGASLLLSYTTPGTYFATVTASTDNTTSSCEIDVQ